MVQFVQLPRVQGVRPPTTLFLSNTIVISIELNREKKGGQWDIEYIAQRHTIDSPFIYSTFRGPYDVSLSFGLRKIGVSGV